MKNLRIILTALCLFLMVLACKKEDPPGPPALTTAAVTGITYSGAITGGIISDDGGEAVTSRGGCWSTSSNPTAADNKTEDGTGAVSRISKNKKIMITGTYWRDYMYLKLHYTALNTCRINIL